MSETGRIIVGICVLIIFYVLTRKYHAWRTGLAYKTIVRDLRSQEAFDPLSAVMLPYAKPQSLFRVGMKDYRPKAVEYLMNAHIVGMTEKGHFYLANRNVEPIDS